MVKIFGSEFYFWVICWIGIMNLWVVWDIYKVLKNIRDILLEGNQYR